MQSWVLWLNAVGLIGLSLLFYLLDKKLSSRVILLAPILVYVAVSLEDLLGLVDFGAVFQSEAILRAVILLFVLGSVIFYLLFIFHEIADSAVKREVSLKSAVIRISIAAMSCIVFFTVVYTSIYKLFKGASFAGDHLGEDTLSQLITFFYFSVATFTTVGYGDIQPMDNTSRLIVVMEIFFSFITVAYALSMIGVFRQIFNKEMGGDASKSMSNEKELEEDAGASPE
ncbi:potassium channel family protein [Paenibacillus sp. alder61]|uniref:potassium channel family protein n=1 Tax=Paenibacillus TaxID=44249 RepID=UPI001CD72237|nr:MULTISPECIES: potassium channel family protein [Paenibacillus]MCA1296035.1 potassium channel family protein [Paenibacillus sp. alder61]